MLTDGLLVTRLHERFVVSAPLRSLSARFPKIRTVQILRGKTLSCSCSYQINYLLPCRHILAINRWRIGIDDIHFRWLLRFSDGSMSRTHNFEDAECFPLLRLSADEIQQVPECKPICSLLSLFSHCPADKNEGDVEGPEDEHGLSASACLPSLT